MALCSVSFIQPIRSAAQRHRSSWLTETGGGGVLAVCTWTAADLGPTSRGRVVGSLVMTL